MKLGIDVSHYQGSIDWEKVAADGKTFAIMKAQYEAGSHRIDEYFEANYKGAGKYGLARGVYIFIGSVSIADPIADAQALVKKLNGRTLEYGIWIDLEAAAVKKLSKAEITHLVHVYANIFEANGYFTGIYCNKDWYNNVLDSKKLAEDYEFWIARYPSNDTGVYNATSSLSPKSYACAWQYSSKGSVSGISGNVDLDVDFDGVLTLTGDTGKKSIATIAKEVIANKWGTASTSPTRQELLEAAGYDYQTVRKKVNELLS